MPSLDEQVRHELVEWETGIAEDIHLKERAENIQTLRKTIEKIEASLNVDDSEARAEVKLIRSKLRELDGMIEEGRQTFWEYFSTCYSERPNEVRAHSEQVVGKYLEFVRIQRSHSLLDKLFSGEQSNEPKVRQITKATAESTIHSYNLAVERFIHSIDETVNVVNAVAKTVEAKRVILTDEVIIQGIKGRFPTAEQYRAFLEEYLHARLEFCEAEIAILDTMLSGNPGEGAHEREKDGWKLVMKYMAPINQEKVKRVYGTND